MGRIAELPRRQWTVGADAVAAAMTAQLRTPHGVQHLWPSQAVALSELPQVGGGFCGMSVGRGKTLISALAPTVLGAVRPLIIVPGKHRAKTEREFQALRENWRLPPHIPIESYERLALEAQSNFFFDYRPTLIICDEAQKLKRLESAAVALRMWDYWKTQSENPCAFLFLSGSPTLKSVKDFAHLMHWALGDGTPLPKLDLQQKAWAAVLDSRPEEGCDLRVISSELGECKSSSEARRLVAARIQETPGVICTEDAFDWPLALSVERYDLPADVAAYYPKLRNAWLAPDDFPLTDCRTEVWAHAMRLSVGLLTNWDPWPPRYWREARKAYGGFVRANTGPGQPYETEKQVRTAVETFRLDCPEYWEWIAVRDDWEPTSVKTMISDVAVDSAAQWLGSERKGSLVWVHNRVLGRHLSKKLGLPFFGPGGLDAHQRSIDCYREGNAIVSIGACYEGFNLQECGFWRNYFLQYPPSAQALEQAIGRTHRYGQRHPYVEVAFAFSCLEHLSALDNALCDARYAEEIFRLPQKIRTHTINRSPGVGLAWLPPQRNAED